jgi:hypothetical protein
VFCVATGHDAALAAASVELPPAVFGALQEGTAVLGAGVESSFLELPRRLWQWDADSPTASAVGCKVLWFESGRPAIVCPFVSTDAGIARPALPDFKNQASVVELVKANAPAAVFFLAPSNDFSLEGLLNRLETVIPQALQVASYFQPPAESSRSTSGSSGGRTFVGGGDWGVDATSRQLPVLTDTAVGVACGGSVSTIAASEVADAAACLLGWTHRSGFALSPALETELFVPTSNTLVVDDSENDGQTGICFLSADAATSVPVFFIPVLLFPTVDLPLRIFEPRYRVLIKECLEKQQPFALVHPNLSGDVGCLVRVVTVDSMGSDGCSTVVVRGIERCAIKQNSLQPDPGVGRFGLATCDATALPEDDHHSTFGSHSSGNNSSSDSNIDQIGAATAAALLMAKIERALPLPQLARAYCDAIGCGKHRTVDDASAALVATLRADPARFAFHYANWLASSAGVPLLEAGRWLSEPSVLGLLQRLCDLLEAYDAKSNR